jgi:hypothetical protein
MNLGSKRKYTSFVSGVHLNFSSKLALKRAIVNAPLVSLKGKNMVKTQTTQKVRLDLDS